MKFRIVQSGRKVDDDKDWWNNHAPSVLPTAIPTSKFSIGSGAPSSTTLIATPFAASVSSSPSPTKIVNPTVTAGSPTSIPFLISSNLQGDGWCDSAQFESLANYDMPEWAFDLGDCCEQTCMRNSLRYFECGVSGYACWNTTLQQYSSRGVLTISIGNISLQDLELAKTVLLVGIDSLLARSAHQQLVTLEYESINLQSKKFAAFDRDGLIATLDIAIVMRSSSLNTTGMNHVERLLEKAIFDGTLQRNTRYFAGRYFQPSLLWVIVCKECFGNYNQDINSIAPAATCENKLMPTNSVPWENVYGRSIWFPIYILLQLIIWVGLAVWAVRKVEYHTVGFISFINRISIFTVLVIRIVYFSLLLTLNPVNWLHVYCHEVTIFDSQYPEHMVLCFLHVTFYQCMIIAVITKLCNNYSKWLITVVFLMIIYSVIEISLSISGLRTNQSFANVMTVLQVVCGCMLVGVGLCQVMFPSNDSRLCRSSFFSVVLLLYGINVMSTTFNMVRYSPVLYLILHTCTLYLLDLILMIWLLDSTMTNEDYQLVEHNTSPTVNNRILPEYSIREDHCSAVITNVRGNAPSIDKRSTPIPVSDRVFDLPPTWQPHWVSRWGACIHNDNAQ